MGGGDAVDDAVIDAERDGHGEAGDDVIANDDGAFGDLADGDDDGLGLVEDGFETIDAEGAEVG